MQSLLENSVCDACGAAQVNFAASRFGATLQCQACGTLSSLRRAAQRFVEEIKVHRGLRDEEGNLTALPWMVGPAVGQRESLHSQGTIRLMCLLQSSKIVLQTNFPTATPDPPSILSVLAALPLYVQQQLQVVDPNTASGPLALCDLLTYELGMLMKTRDFVPTLFDGVPTSTQRLVARTPAGGDDTNYAGGAQHRACMQRVDPRLLRYLLRHQVEGVQRALDFGGRILIGDQCGSGKTLTALAIIQALDAFPTLLVCPAGLRCMWASIVEEWTLALPVGEVALIASGNDKLQQDRTPKFVICSFHMLTALAADLQSRPWACIVVDESHALRPSVCNTGEDDALWTRMLHTMIQRAPHAVLLSGTPSLSNPFGMFVQVDALRPRLLGPSRLAFAWNYCKISCKPHLELGGSTRAKELRELLLRFVMIRRIKEDLLEDLPPKRTTVVAVPLDHDHDERAQHSSMKLDDAGVSATVTTSADGNPAVAEVPTQFCGVLEEDVGSGASQAALFATHYANAWRRRRKSTVDFVNVYLRRAHEQGTKLVLFAHHVELLQLIHDHCVQWFAQQTRKRQRGSDASPERERLRLAETLSMIYIDGSVAPASRGNLVERFAQDPYCLVAIVGITASSVGISLAAASTCIFLEVPPDAAFLVQAEDRLHRAEQSSVVSSIILIGSSSTFEARMLQRVEQAIRSTSVVVDGDRVEELVLCSQIAVSHNKNATGSVGVAASAPSSAVCSGTGQYGRQPYSPPPTVSALITYELPAHSDVRFRMSPVTSRIHVAVRADAALEGDPEFVNERSPMVQLGSLSLLDAHRCVADLERNAQISRGVWSGTTIVQELSSYLDAYEAMTPYMRRRWRLQVHWCSVREIWASFVTGATVESSIQVKARHNSEHPTSARPAAIPSRFLSAWTAPPQRGPFVTYRIQWRADAPHTAYCGPVRWNSAHRQFSALCLHCDAELLPQCFYCPGALVTLDSRTDASLFCSGTCRESYRVLHSSAAVRGLLTKLDSGVCASCGVDCRALVDALRACPTISLRRNKLEELHPHFLEDAPHHATLLLRNPVEGNCWNADHIVAVTNGGGSCNVENFQTLCVPCHLQKTRADLCAARRETHTTSPQPIQNCAPPVLGAPVTIEPPLPAAVTTVDMARDRMLQLRPRRVALLGVGGDRTVDPSSALK